ncbi:transcriptional regulator [Gluconacetobacter sacchari DSM 12717]|uniref:PLP-dependent aminotransferase family protein n=2 Tax=Gluconacetobacter sacchari TaxID=92759 RepID=A0A7W4IFK8_9PROT|nr:PLP-dependent aminotransferase family protein [Gluconacetobacter sacchari]MBB2161949.1 PLP-dependent aminotransferase family protein [Gluconacetobacter sacchari]GBQ20736.1 transcriptional regulator [Gluconacetobacter sacchari DSM 12717]
MTAMWTHILANVTEGDGGTLQTRLREGLVRAIEEGLLRVGMRLPSSRALAASLGISRNTTVLALERLVEEGYLVARDRSGLYVADLGHVADPMTSRDAPPGEKPAGHNSWHSRFAVRPSLFRHISKPANWADYPYPFLFGQSDPALFPLQEWRECVRMTSGAAGVSLWAADTIDEDDPKLIEQLCLHVLPRRGIRAVPDEVMITLGAQQALSLVIRLLAGAGRRVGLENPSYPDVRHMLAIEPCRSVILDIDEEGLKIGPDAASCDVIITTPGHQCPTTAIMPLSRRQALMDLAARHDLILVEDDYDTALFEEELALPALKSLDIDGRVIHISSFSKVIAPGLRIGYVVASRPLIDELRALRRLILRHPPRNNQRALAQFIALGHYRTHLRRMGRILHDRARMMEEMLPRYLPLCRWRRDPGATSFWVRDPQHLGDSVQLAAMARAQGVLIEPGDPFFVTPGTGRSMFRLGFASIDASRIEEGLRRLGAVMTG